MTKAQEDLKEDIEKINDDTTIEKVRIFIMGILAQQSISENQRNPTKLENNAETLKKYLDLKKEREKREGRAI